MRSYCVTAFGEPLQLMEQPTPVPQGAEVLLQVRAAGVCHSDLHLQDGGYDLGQGRMLKLADRGINLPLTMGHEVVGKVVALGPDASGAAPGDVRLIFPWIGCGCCPACRRGTENLCATPNCIGVNRAGGYADHILVPDAKYLIDIAPLTPGQAAPFACSGLTAYSALKKLGTLLSEQPVGIIGAGGVGLMAVSLVKALGEQAQSPPTSAKISVRPRLRQEPSPPSMPQFRTQPQSFQRPRPKGFLRLSILLVPRRLRNLA